MERSGNLIQHGTTIGRWELQNDIVTVTTLDGRSKSTQIGNLPLETLTKQLARELVREAE